MQNHSEHSKGSLELDSSGYWVTAHGGRIAPDVNLERISTDAVIKGNSLIEGGDSLIEGGAVIDDSYCRNVFVADGAHLADCSVESTGHPHSHQCDAAGRYLARGSAARVEAGALIDRCQVVDSMIGPGSRVVNSTLLNCGIGPDNSVDTAKMTLVHTERSVRVDGPTEISEAWLGRKTHIHRQGYFEGVFSNDFLVLDYDEQSGRMSVKEIIDIPHVSGYGTNTINSTNSGRLLPQPDSVMRSFGRPVGLWHDPLLSHEPILLGPCSWVCSWTKVIGASSRPYAEPLETVTDDLHTYLMPFAAAGYGGMSTTALVPPGQKSNGYGNKLRSGAWTFTHCPDAVINMVHRLYEALEDDEKRKADIVAEASLNNALCLLRHQADQLGFDMSKPRELQRGSKAKWLWDCRNLLDAHVRAGIWRFQSGRPIGGWQHHHGKWQHEALTDIRRLAPLCDDPFDLTEADLLAEPADPDIRRVSLESPLQDDDFRETTASTIQPDNQPETATPTGNDESPGQTGLTPGAVDPTARIHDAAVIDRTARIGAGVTVAENCYVGPGTVLDGKTIVGPGTWLFRTVLRDATVGSSSRLCRCMVCGTSQRNAGIGDDARLTGCKVIASDIGSRTAAIGARVVDSIVVADTTLDMFAVLENVHATKPVIIGGRMTDCRIDTVLMSMHTAGEVSGLIAEPVRIDIDASQMTIPAIPMLGGGCQIQGRGVGENAVVMEAAFIGSNAIVKAGSYIGFGSFVLDKLNSDEGLLPFTVSRQAGPATDEIGGVLTRFANIVITHIINWTFQAMPAGENSNIVQLINGGIRRGMAAIEAELARRQDNQPWNDTSDFARYKSLPHYTDQQLREGLARYKECLELGQWELAIDDGNLVFTNARGHWCEKGGSVRWCKDSQSE